MSKLDKVRAEIEKELHEEHKQQMIEIEAMRRKNLEYKPQGPPAIMGFALLFFLTPFIIFTVAAVMDGRMDLDIALGLWGSVVFVGAVCGGGVRV